MTQTTLPDLDCEENIQRFVDLFYHALLNDPLLAPIFTDVAKIELEQHKPLIVAYWCKLLLGHRNYNRHTMNIHRHLNQQQQLTREMFDRWYYWFQQILTSNFSGAYADRAKKVAGHIAQNMFHATNPDQSPLHLHH